MIHRREFLLAAYGATALAQEPTASSKSDFTTGTMQVMAPTTVLNKSTGEYASGLQAGDFELFDNDIKQKIEVDISYIPISLAVVVQKSAQTTEMLPKIMRIASMLDGVITGDQGLISLLAFDHRLDLLQDLTNEPEKIKTALSKLRPGSNSSVAGLISTSPS